MKPEDFIIMPIPTDRYIDVCALLGGVASAAISASAGNAKPVAAKQDADPAAPSNSTTEASGDVSDAGADTGAEGNTGEIDAHGHPWSAELHASTKGKTKEGLWRMKPGASRPDPLPGFPIESDTDTGTSSETNTNSATSPAAAEPEAAPAATGDDDEFAAFRAAAEASNAVDEAAAANVVERSYSDADLGALCNQAAVKLGDPAPIKEIIAQFMPDGVVPHSRNVPDDKRAEFVKAIEDKAGIEFAG